MFPVQNLGPLTDEYSLFSDWNNDWLSGLKSTIKWYLDNIEYLKIDSSQSYSGERLGKNK